MVIKQLLLRFRLIGLLIVPILISCGSLLEIAVFNNSGEAVSVQLRRGNHIIEPGRFFQFEYPQSTQAGIMSLNVGNCIYKYKVPNHLEHYPWSLQEREEPVKVQLEKDLTIFILPPGTVAVEPISNLSDLQQDGFPLHPISKSCR